MSIENKIILLIAFIALLGAFCFMLYIKKDRIDFLFKWFLKGFERDYDTKPDWKKLTLFPLTCCVVFVVLYVTLKGGTNGKDGYNDPMFNSLLLFMASILGVAMVPAITKAGAGLKQAEMESSKKPDISAADKLKLRAIAVGLAENASEAEIIAKENANDKTPGV